MLKYSILLILSFFSYFSYAKQIVSVRDAEGNNCWVKSGVKYQIDPWLLMAIAYTESRFNPNAISPANRNGSRDYYFMQINNRVWFPTLKKYGISTEHLKNACVSVDVGAWILSHSFKMYGYKWSAVGAYNTGPGGYKGKVPQKTARNYINKVYNNYYMLKKRYAVPEKPATISTISYNE